MQTANALLALSLFAKFNYVDRLKKRAPKNQEAPFMYAADFVRKHKSSRVFSITEYTHVPRCRSSTSEFETHRSQIQKLEVIPNGIQLCSGEA